MMSSPECAADMKPRQQWLLAALAPVGLALLFLTWACCARRYQRKKTMEHREGTMQAILQSAVYVLLIGCYKTMVQTSLEILNCEPVDGNWMLTMDGEPCPLFAEDNENRFLAFFGIFLFGMYAVLPFSLIAFQLWYFARSGKLEEHLTSSYRFRLAVGW